MPLIQTLEIEEALTARDADHERSEAKRAVIGIAAATRHLALGVRRRLDERDARDAAAPAQASGRVEPQAGSVAADTPPLDAVSRPPAGETGGEPGSLPEGLAAAEQPAEA
jgi:hypothetical protein